MGLKSGAGAGLLPSQRPAAGWAVSYLADHVV
jgi:hypothetical protein